MLVVDNQSGEVLERYGLTRGQVDRAVWAVDAAGSRWEGAAAISRVLIELGGTWRMVGRIAAVPGLAWLATLLYRLVAANRGRLAALAAGGRRRGRPPPP